MAAGVKKFVEIFGDLYPKATKCLLDLVASPALYEWITSGAAEEAHVDRGYRGHNVTDCGVWITGKLEWASKAEKRRHKRRNAIEPMIGHMKTDGRLGRCPLISADGDACFAALRACGQNIGVTLMHIRIILCLFFYWFFPHIFHAERHARRYRTLELTPLSPGQ